VRAEEMEQQGLKAIDALHLACAEAAHADYFITCDDEVIRRYKEGRTKRAQSVSAGGSGSQAPGVDLIPESLRWQPLAGLEGLPARAELGPGGREGPLPGVVWWAGGHGPAWDG